MNDMQNAKANSPMELAMSIQKFAFEVNMQMKDLLLGKMSRIRLAADTAQALMDDNDEIIKYSIENYCSDKNMGQEWQRLEDSRKNIETALRENLGLFKSAHEIFKRTAQQTVNLNELDLPAVRLDELRKISDKDRVYDNMQEYNEILFQFLQKISRLCTEISMRLVKMSAESK